MLALTNLNTKYHANFWTLVWSQLDLCLRDSAELYFTPRAQISNLTRDNQNHSFGSKFTDQPEFRCTHLDKLVDLFSSNFRNLTVEAAIEVCICVLHSLDASLILS
jgi:hypothetical protein